MVLFSLICESNNNPRREFGHNDPRKDFHARSGPKSRLLRHSRSRVDPKSSFRSCRNHMRPFPCAILDIFRRYFDWESDRQDAHSEDLHYFRLFGTVCSRFSVFYQGNADDPGY